METVIQSLQAVATGFVLALPYIWNRLYIPRVLLSAFAPARSGALGRADCKRSRPHRSLERSAASGARAAVPGGGCPCDISRHGGDARIGMGVLRSNFDCIHVHRDVPG